MHVAIGLLLIALLFLGYWAQRKVKAEEPELPSVG
jgi:hypothetical protein